MYNQNTLRKMINDASDRATKALALAKKNKNNSIIRHHALNMYFRNREEVNYCQKILNKNER